MSATTNDTMLIPEEKCAHFELRNMGHGRSTCPDCGQLIDAGSTPMFTGVEVSRAYGDGEEAGGRYARRWAVEEATKAADSLHFAIDRSEVLDDGSVLFPAGSFTGVPKAENILRTFIERASDA